MRFRVACVTLLLVCSASIGRAIPLHIYDPETTVLEGGEELSKDELVGRALALPQVSFALQNMMALGYTLCPAGNNAKYFPENGITQVVLTFTDPGNASYVPVVVVQSRPFGSSVRTTVETAVVNVNVQSGALSDAIAAPDDAFFESTLVNPDGLDSNYSATCSCSCNCSKKAEPRQRFISWMECTGKFCAGATVTCGLISVATGPFSPPAVASCSLLACAFGAGFCAGLDH